MSASPSPTGDPSDAPSLHPVTNIEGPFPPDELIVKSSQIKDFARRASGPDDKTTFKFDVFISYRRAADKRMASGLQSYIEGFHQTRTGKRLKLRALNVSLDKNGFSRRIPLRESMLQNLTHSKNLLVLACPAAAAAPENIDEEISMFLKTHSTGDIHMAITEGKYSHLAPEGVFTPLAVARSLHQKQCYDFRGVRDKSNADERFDDERLNLVAELYGLHVRILRPLWLQEVRRRKLMQITAAAAILVFATAATIFGISDRKAKALKLVAEAAGLQYRDPPAAIFKALDAQNIYRTREAEETLAVAMNASFLHDSNQASEITLDGRGAPYLARQWSRGSLFSRLSPDGKYSLTVTRRGEDGTMDDGVSRQGEVYLLDNQSLQSVQLKTSRSGRVEAATFTHDSRLVCVSRYFDTYVFDITGKLIAEIPNPGTKSPIHLIGGTLKSDFILIADTVKAWWLVSLRESAPKPQRVKSKTYINSPLVKVCMNRKPESSHALLIYENGKSQVLVLSSKDKHLLLDVPVPDVMTGGVHVGPAATIIVVAARDGTVHVMNFKQDALSLPHRLDLKLTGSLVGDVYFDSSGNRVLITDAIGEMQIYDLAADRICLKREEKSWMPPVLGTFKPAAIATGGGYFSRVLDKGAQPLLVTKINIEGDLLWMIGASSTPLLMKDDILHEASSIAGVEEIMTAGGQTFFAGQKAIHLTNGDGSTLSFRCMNENTGWFWRAPKIVEDRGCFWVACSYGGLLIDPKKRRAWNVLDEDHNVRDFESLPQHGVLVSSSQGVFLANLDRTVSRLTQRYVNGGSMVKGTSEVMIASLHRSADKKNVYTTLVFKNGRLQKVADEMAPQLAARDGWFWGSMQEKDFPSRSAVRFNAKGEMTIFKELNGFSPQRVQEPTTGEEWLCYGGSLYLFSDGKLTPKVESDTTLNRLTLINGRLWYWGNGGKIWRVEGREAVNVPGVIGEVDDLLWDGERLWAFCSDGPVYYLADNAFQRFSISEIAAIARFKGKLLLHMRSESLFGPGLLYECDSLSPPHKLRRLSASGWRDLSEEETRSLVSGKPAK